MATYKDASGTAEKDIEVAKLIAEAHQKDLALIALESPAKSDFQELFGFKKGHSMLDMAFMIPFLKNLSQRHEGSAVFTGDGGDKVLPSLLPVSRFFSGPKLKTYALRANLKFSEVKAAKLFGLDTKSIQDSIDQLFDRYPEKTWEGKYLRFTMENRARNWLFEGEDRNRYFLPSFTPFYSLPLFNLLMSVGDKEKRDFVFFDKFLKSAAPKTARIKNANWGFSSENRKQIRKIYFREELKLTGPGKLIKKQLKKSKNYFEQASAAELSLFEEYSSLNRESGRMDFRGIKNFQNLGADPFYNLLTLLMAASEAS
jgi:asparagine synthase (glutamine-hydrolysing)